MVSLDAKHIIMSQPSQQRHDCKCRKRPGGVRDPKDHRNRIGQSQEKQGANNSANKRNKMSNVQEVRFVAFSILNDDRIHPDVGKQFIEHYDHDQRRCDAEV